MLVPKVYLNNTHLHWVKLIHSVKKEPTFDLTQEAKTLHECYVINHEDYKIKT